MPLEKKITKNERMKRKKEEKTNAKEWGKNKCHLQTLINGGENRFVFLSKAKKWENNWKRNVREKTRGAVTPRLESESFHVQVYIIHTFIAYSNIITGTVQGLGNIGNKKYLLPTLYYQYYHYNY